MHKEQTIGELIIRRNKEMGNNVIKKDESRDPESYTDVELPGRVAFANGFPSRLCYKIPKD